ncbi:hypothetical protein GCK72_017344 [Caenorhabditis remanei]|uniref:Uncharacterized protein n=1 Tax=Caenorhabditis remanei TaxID=31234 RepID=A0A6A5G7S6_CAERE|nr:hypothetical protein GCK72_017344 [Caenorhabditis remanei]KAF1750793.1 hypothetical protein GCK72_017344 [Caenorhabditis remanei]
MLARPFIHNYNISFIYFSLSVDISTWRYLVQALLVAYSGIYSSLISFVAVQFIYRYLVLVNTQILEILFHGWKSVVWVFYVTFFGVAWSALVYFCLYPNSYSKDYIREEFEKVYNISVDNSAIFILVAYNIDQSTNEYKLRWQSVTMIAGTVSILLIQYAIMIFCGTSMHLQMNEKLKNFSDVHQRLQKQFFKTLLLQIGVPTVLFHMPIFPVLLAPFFNFKFSYQTGIIYSLFCSYPPIDALIIMTVVSDYRSALTKLFGGNHQQVATTTGRTEVVTITDWDWCTSLLSAIIVIVMLPLFGM